MQRIGHLLLVVFAALGFDAAAMSAQPLLDAGNPANRAALLDSVTQARARWQAARPQIYRISVELECECAHPLDNAPWVLVSGDSILRDSVRADQRWMVASRPGYYTTDGLFAALDSALRDTLEIVTRVRFDRTAGIPMSFDTQRRCVSDRCVFGGTRVQVRGFESVQRPRPIASLAGRDRLEGGVSSLTVRSQDADACGVYEAALGRLVPDSVRTLVVYDSVSLAVPSFAFHAWTGMGFPRSDSKVPLTDSLWQNIRSAHHERDALPDCFGAGKRVVRVPYDSLYAPFKDRADGWTKFAAAFPGARGFYIVGRPYFMNAERTQCMVYIAFANDWLGGSGQVVYLRKTGGMWQVIGIHSLWVS